MMNRTIRWLALVLAVTVLASGCVTKKMYRKQVDETDQRIAGVESGVETNERRIEDLAEETDAQVAAAQAKAEKAVEIGSQAQSEATAAKQAAEKAQRGRLLWSVTLSNDKVRFGFGKDELPDEAKGALDELASKVKTMDKAVFLEIEGHTDNIGAPEYNTKLGEQRALAVRHYLADKGGIPLHAMNVISYGESRPVADNSTPEGRAQNRRVVVRVLE